MADDKYIDLITGKPLEPWAEQAMKRTARVTPTEADRQLYGTLLGLADTNRQRRERGEPIVNGLELIARHRLAALSERERAVREAAGLTFDRIEVALRATSSEMFAESEEISDALIGISESICERREKMIVDVLAALSEPHPIARKEAGANGQPVGIFEIAGQPVEVDAEIAPIVRALNATGVPTVASCSGHGNRPGAIALADGREIIIARDYAEARRLDALSPLDINGDPLSPPVPDALAELEWFGTHRNLELSFYSPTYGDDDDLSEEWRVHRVGGGINDREWTLVGAGATPLAAVQAARSLLATEGRAA